MGGAPIIGYSGKGGSRGGGGIDIPFLLILAGGGIALWYFGFGPGKGQLSDIESSIGKGIGGIGSTIGGNFNSGVNRTVGNLTWIQDYSGYILGAGIVLALIMRIMPKPKGAGGLIMQLIPWTLILGGGFIFMTNFTAGGVPNIGAAIKGALHPTSNAGYAMPITPSIPMMMPRQYRPVKGAIITGTQQNGPINPAYDKNTPFSMIGDVY